ncbi:MAG: metallophosphoesterase family protein [Anaerolineales bacterium]|nr:metallophosphoesterase family protein [Anaerolineales bacterium]
MNNLTIFGDIHANLPALEAVFKDMDEWELSQRYCLGDLVGYATFPNEVVNKIRALEIPTIMGNYDQGIGNSSDECGCAYKTDFEKVLGKRSINWTNRITSPENKEYLRELPSQFSLKLDGFRILLVHGSPRRINEYLYADRPESSLERIMDQTDADVLVCGHTHLPYHKILPSGRHVINAGSVGKPKDNDVRAGYIILETTENDLDVRFIRVPYDIEKAALAIESSDMPDEYAELLRHGTG